MLMFLGSQPAYDQYLLLVIINSAVPKHYRTELLRRVYTREIFPLAVFGKEFNPITLDQEGYKWHQWMRLIVRFH